MKSTIINPIFRISCKDYSLLPQQHYSSEPKTAPLSVLPLLAIGWVRSDCSGMEPCIITPFFESRRIDELEKRSRISRLEENCWRTLIEARMSSLDSEHSAGTSLSRKLSKESSLSCISRVIQTSTECLGDVFFSLVSMGTVLAAVSPPAASTSAALGGDSVAEQVISVGSAACVLLCSPLWSWCCWRWA